MKCFAVFAKVLCACHESSHLLEDSRSAPANLSPRPAESMNRSGSKRRDDGRERGVIIERTAFLWTMLVTKKPSQSSKKGRAYIGHINEVLDYHNAFLHVALCENHLSDPIGQLIRMQDQRLDIGGGLGLPRSDLLLPCLVQAFGCSNFGI